MLKAEIVAQVVANKKSGKWLSCHFDLDHNGQSYKLGVKAFGLWVQRFELCGIVSNVPEQKTNKRFKELAELEIDVMLKSIAA